MTLLKPGRKKYTLYFRNTGMYALVWAPERISIIDGKINIWYTTDGILIPCPGAKNI